MSPDAEPQWMPGAERDRGPDENGFPYKECCMGIAECPKCGKDVPLIAETESWVEDEKTGAPLHDGYGPSQGVCCGVLIVDSWDGTQAYDLTRAGESGDESDADEDDDWEFIGDDE